MQSKHLLIGVIQTDACRVEDIIDIKFILMQSKMRILLANIFVSLQPMGITIRMITEYLCFNKGNEYAKRKTRNITNAGFCGEINY